MVCNIRILILTPCFNACEHLSATFDSIISQKSDAIDITYSVCDGSSSDGTEDLISDYLPRFSACGIRFRFFSEPDTGMYHALSNGFRKHSAESFDIYAYLNAGDRYAPRAFSNIRHFFETGSNWITGISVFNNPNGDIVGARLPGPYPRRLIRTGHFGRLLPCIQQESTFWSAKAHACLDLDQLERYKLAGDYYIWRTFSEKFELQIVGAWLSGFTFQPGQLSVIRKDEYFAELRQISWSRNPILYLYSLYIGAIWLLPDGMKKKLFSDSYLQVAIR